MNSLELLNPKVLIRSDQANKAKGKNIIIGEQRPDEKLSLEETPKIAVKASTLRGQGTTEKADGASTGLATAQGGLTGSRGGLTGSQGSLRVPGWSDRYFQKNGDAPKKNVRSSFEELLAKYKRKGAVRKRRNRPVGGKGKKHNQDMRSKKMCITNKVILFILLLDHLHHALGIILVITHLPIIVVCT
jgi:hypothetical protein